MPLSIHLTEGVIPAGSERQAVKKITDIMLKWHGLSGNKVMTPNITAMVQVLAKGTTFSGGQEVSGAWIEFKTPSFAFTDRDVQVGVAKEATDVIYELSGGKQPRDNIYFNVTHAVDGSWNLDGIAMTNEELGQAIAKG
ncbi:MAG TPA: 4-oxalocrotonate tautomerase [Oceanospirillales bacterium]|nr:4-oxalocrotonate tautomerase [Oceanospirillales bacterium]